jgi:hypothetical protein
VFSSIIGRVIVVKPMWTTLAPGSFAPGLRRRTLPSWSMSTKTFSSIVKSLIA